MKIDTQPSIEAYDRTWSDSRLCFTQHRAWGEVKAGTYTAHYSLADNLPLAVHTRSLPIIRSRYGYAPRAFSDGTLPNAHELAELSDQLCRQYRLSHLVIEPNAEMNELSELDAFRQAGFTLQDETIQPRHSRLIDLTLPDDALKADMTKDVRRRITRGEEAGYSFGEQTDARGLEEFYKGLSEVAERAKFDIQPRRYFGRIMEAFPRDMVHIYLCRDAQSRLLYAMFSLLDGEAFRRIYGGPTLAGRSGDAAQFTAWQAIKAAQGLGGKTMDLWGVAPHDNDGYVPGHPLSGVSRFKASLGGRDATYYPQLIWVRDKVRFTAYQAAVRGYRSGKRLKRIIG